MTRSRTLMSLLLLALAPAASSADDYRLQITGAFDRATPDNFPGDLDTLNLSAAWFFAPVSTDGVPLAEAAFLGRASSLNAVVSRVEVFGTHLNAQAAGVSYYLPDTMFYARVGAQRVETAIGLSSTAVVTEYDTQWVGALGLAPLDGLLVTTEFDEDGYDPNITARYVGKLPNSHFYAGSVSIVEPDFGDTYIAVDFDYFLDDSTSLGAGYSDRDERLELRAEKFFSPNWAAGVSAFTADRVDGFGVHVTWRH